MTPADLTIAIPTYRRRDTILETVALALDASQGLDIAILVADNASGDGTVEALRERFGEHCRVIAGEMNGGFVVNFERLVDGCTTEHLLLLSDEESVADTATLRRLLAWLEAERPDFAVPGPSREVHLERPLRTEEFWDATKYLSGCIFRMDALRESRERLREGLVAHRFDVLWELWPMFVVAMDLAIRGGSCRYFPHDLYSRRLHLPTMIESAHFGAVDERRAAGVEPMRARYKTLEARLVQAQALAEFLTFQSRTISTRDETRRLAGFTASFEQGLGPMFLRRLASDYPALQAPLVRSLRRETSVCSRLRRLCAAVIARWERQRNAQPAG